VLLQADEEECLICIIVPNLFIMFIRVKKVKKERGEYEYAHLVSGIWRRKRLVRDINEKKFRKYNNSIHKYEGMIGRVYRFENKKEIGLAEFLGCRFEDFVVSKNTEDIYAALIQYELCCCGFKEINGVYHGGRMFVDLNRLIVHDGCNDVVLKIQERSGYLCSLSLRGLFDIKKISGRYEGILLMKKLKMAGVKINADDFFVLVNKMLEN